MKSMTFKQNRKFFALICLIIINLSCRKSDAPRLNHDKAESTKPIVSENKPILILPIHIDSTNYIVHAVGEIKPYSSRSYSSEYSGGDNYNSVHYSGYTISGDISNLYFEHLKTQKITTLTDRPIRINSVKFLEKLYVLQGQKLLMYHARDKDTDANGKLDSNDVEALYISNIDGTDFTKLTEDFHDLIDYKIIPENNRLYFRTIEDTNKDGDFNKDDTFNNYYVDLDGENWKAKTYNFSK